MGREDIYVQMSSMPKDHVCKMTSFARVLLFLGLEANLEHGRRRRRWGLVEARVLSGHAFHGVLL